MIFNKRKVVAIIQARMGSTRLPGKVLMPICGKPSIHIMYDRIMQSKCVDDVVIATTSDIKDDCIRNYCYDVLKCSVYRGSNNDVLGRVLKSATIAKADIIVDLTADCPLVDPLHIGILVREVKNNHHDYASNTIIRSWPDGFDIQVYTRELLCKVDKIVTDYNHRCHVGWNIIHYIDQLRIDGKIKILNYRAATENFYPEWGLTLDEEEDYELLKVIFKHFNDSKEFKNKIFTAQDVISFIKKDISILNINSKIKRKIPGQG